MKNKSYNVIIDTNVFVSAFITKDMNSPVVKIVEMFYDGVLNLYYSDDTMNEYKDVLSRKGFGFDKAFIGGFINYIKKIGIKYNPKKLDDELLDVKDLPFYELVMDKNIQDSKLISGNIKHFPKNTKIVTPSEFIKLIE